VPSPVRWRGRPSPPLRGPSPSRGRGSQARWQRQLARWAARSGKIERGGGEGGRDAGMGGKIERGGGKIERGGGDGSWRDGRRGPARSRGAAASLDLAGEQREKKQCARGRGSIPSFTKCQYSVAHLLVGCATELANSVAHPTSRCATEFISFF
jgi:hypothetical protein